MKKVDSAIASNNAAGDGWFKIWDEGYDEAAGKWCTSKMIENNGHLSVTVPSDIEGGYYLVRPELLALHAATANPPDPQFYVGCAQIYLDSTGAAKPATISIPDNYVDISMPGMTFNIYSTPLALPYPMYGPKAYEAGGSQASPSPSVSASASPASSSRAVAYSSAPAYGEATDSAGDNSDEECDATEGNDTTADAGAASTSSSAAGSSATPVVTNNQSPVNGQSEGLKPEGCILENANWCGFEVKSYTDENGCWSSSADCWKQSQDCYDKTPPTGYKNCEIWGDKCNHLDDTCKAKQFPGPPDAGKDLTPTRQDLSTTASRKLMALVKKHESHVMKGANRLRHE
jgi:Auxiliary Activity family 9 (formerly GH61)